MLLCVIELYDPRMPLLPQALLSLLGKSRPWQISLTTLLVISGVIAGMGLLNHGEVTLHDLITGVSASLAMAYLIKAILQAQQDLVGEAAHDVHLFGDSNDAIGVVDERTGCFTDTNTAWHFVYGYSKAEAVKLTPRDLLAHEKGPNGPAAFDSEHHGLSPGLQWHRHKDGHVFPVDISFAQVLADDRTLLYITTRLVSNRMDGSQARTLHERAMAASSVGISITDMQAPDTPLIYVNPAFEKITGYAWDDAVGRNCSSFIYGTTDTPSGLESIRTAFEQGREGQALVYSYRKDGTPYWNELIITPVRDNDGTLTHFIGIMKDVTQRKQIEATLERYEFIANAVGEMMSVISRDHRYEAVNDKWCEVLGQKREAVLGASLVRVWGEATYSKSIAPMLEQCFKEGRPQSLIARIEMPNQGERDCSIAYYPYHAPNGEVTHVVVVTRDVTEQLHTEQALQESDSRFRAVLDSVVDGIIVINDKGVIETFNPAAERIFGYSMAETVGQNVSILMPEPYRSQHNQHMKRYVASRQSKIIGVGMELVGLRKNGETFPMDLAVSEMHIGQRTKFVGIARDISGRKQAEMELVQTLEVAQNASRAKSEFLSSMSHELRTPLNAILGFAQLLEIDPGMGQEQSDDVKEIIKAGQHLLELINEVLDLSRIESGTFIVKNETVALLDMITECSRLVMTEATTRGIQVDWDIKPCADRHVLADHLRLKQVLLNLLSNAIKYNRRGGSVHLECTTLPNNRLRLSVKDTGIGIPQARQAELFTAFQRLGQERSGIEGTGIGLLLCKRLMQMMGGEIGMESRQGKGSTFWIDLVETDSLAPASPQQNTEADKGPAPLAGGRRHTVLYVEDNPANLKLMQHVMANRPNLRLISSEEPIDGLEQARKQRPDLILLDINLPGMDGFAVLALLREWEETRSTPIVGISANAMPQDIARAKAAGFTDYLTKPLDIKHLMQTVDAALGIQKTG